MDFITGKGCNQQMAFSWRMVDLSGPRMAEEITVQYYCVYTKSENHYNKSVVV